MQFSVFAYQILHLSSPFTTKSIFSFVLCPFPRKSQEQALGPPKLKFKPHPKGQERDNSMWGLVWENLSGAVLNMAWTCFHLTFHILATSNIPGHQKLNTDVKIKVIAAWWKPYAGVTQKNHTQKGNGLDCRELSHNYRSQIWSKDYKSKWDRATIITMESSQKDSRSGKATELL